MKKASLILNIILIIAVLLLYIDRFVNNPKTQETKKDISKVTEASNSDIVYVNIDTLVDNYDLYNKLMLDFMQKQKDFENQLNSKMLSYQQKGTSLQQQYEKHLITSATYQTKGEQLI